MKIVNMVCPNCRASIQVDADKKNLTCNYCGNNLYLDDEVQHVQYDNAEETGYQFEKGRQRAQAEARGTSTPQNGYTVQQQLVKKRKTWLWVLGWICIFPLPLTILLLRKKDMKPVLKCGIIVVAWLVYLLIGLSGRLKDDNKNNTQNDETAVVSETTTETKNLVSKFISDINESGEIKLEFVEDFIPSDKNSSHYRTEFRLDAYRDALGKSYKYGDATIDIILSSNGAIERIYMEGALYEQCENMIRYASPLLDSTVTDSDIQETIDYIAEHKSANGYCYAKLGLLMLGGGDKGYEFMLKLS